MANQTAIGAVLTTCGFTLAPERDFIMGNEGLDHWTAFTLIGHDDLASIAKIALCHNTSFSIGVLKLNCLAALKFWITDKIRMKKNHVTTQYTYTPITMYISSMQLLSQRMMIMVSLLMAYN